MSIIHIITLSAYELKDGGFRGVILIRDTKERIASPILSTLKEATYWVKSNLYNMMKDVPYKLAPIRIKNEYRANVWVREE